VEPALLAVVLTSGTAAWDFREDQLATLVERCATYSFTEEPTALLPAANAYLERGGGPPETRAQVYTFRAKALARLGKFKDAKRDYEEALRLRPRDPLLKCERARMLGKLGSGRDAVVELASIIRDAPQFAPAHAALAAEYLALGDVRRCHANADKAIELDRGCADAYYTRALAHYSQNEFANCREDLDRVLAIQPYYPPYPERLYLLRAQVLWRLGEPSLALESAAFGALINPSSRESLRGLGELFSTSGKPHLAAHFVRRAQRLYPRDTEIQLLSGKVFLRGGWVAEAEEALTAASQRTPNHVDVYHLRGAVALAHGAYGKAIGAFEKALRIAPSHQESLSALAMVLSTCPAAHYRDGKRAVRLAESLCKTQGAGQPEQLLLLGTAFAELGEYRTAVSRLAEIVASSEELKRDVQNRLHLFQKCLPYRSSFAVSPRPSRSSEEHDELLLHELLSLSVFPFPPGIIANKCTAYLETRKGKSEIRARVHGLRAETFARVGKFKEAKRDYEEALRLCPEDLLLKCKRARMLGELGSGRQAVAELTSIIKNAPQCAPAHAGLAAERLALGDVLLCHANADRAIELDRNCADAYYTRALAYYSQNEFAKCRDTLARLLSLRPYPSTYPVEDPYSMGARAHWFLGQDRSAFAHTRMALLLNKASGPGRVTLVHMHLKAGAFRLARQTARQVATDHPNNSAALDHYARSLLFTGHTAQAYEIAVKALALDDRDPDAHCRLGDVEFTRGRYAEATRAYTRALALDPNHCDTLVGLATLYSTCPDEKFRNGRDAIRLAYLACKWTGGKDPCALLTLATAYAEHGLFPQAMKWGQAAVDSCKTNPSFAVFLRRVCQQRLQLFQRGEAVRASRAGKWDTTLLP
jgi:tetratricopeptide (TPR) repeat protein